MCTRPPLAASISTAARWQKLCACPGGGRSCVQKSQNAQRPPIACVPRATWVRAANECVRFGPPAANRSRGTNAHTHARTHARTQLTPNY